MKKERCERCGEWLTPGKEVWLELNAHTGRFHEANVVPVEESQGWFAFGATCARRILALKQEQG